MALYVPVSIKISCVLWKVEIKRSPETGDRPLL